MATKGLEKSDSLEFLYKEFEFLHKMRDNATKQSESRVSYFFVIISGLIAILSWYFGDKSFQTVLPIIPIAILAFFLIFGLVSYWRLVFAHINIIIYTRAINRIRGFMNENSIIFPIKKALLLPVTDETPEFGGFGFKHMKGKVYFLGLTGLMGFMNSGIFTVIIAIICLQYINISIELTACISVASFIIIFVLQSFCSKILLDKQDEEFRKRYKIYFPKVQDNIE
jgi:hypothetical protein